MTTTKKADEIIPLSHHREAYEWVYTSGQVGRELDGTVPADFARQARLAFEALGRQLAAGGASFASVVKTTVFLTRQEDFAEMNRIYAEYFPQPWPTRSTLVVGLALPGLQFEIEAVAVRAES